MPTLYLATDDGPVVVTGQDDQWQTAQPVDLPSTSCIAADPKQPGRVYCGTWGQGVWRSDNAGSDFKPVFEGIPHGWITSVAVSAAEHTAGRGVVYAGTEPSAMFRSEDAGANWRQCTELTDLASASSWSFPPRPHTHHVRWIELDTHTPGLLFVAIEAGALISSPDGGQTWHDRNPGSPYDTHELASHPKAPGRLWSAAGDGFFESTDGGSSWSRREEGLRFRYCWSVAVDPAEAGSAVLSAAPGPRQAHTPGSGTSGLYRRTGDGDWQETQTGLAEPEKVRARVVAANPSEPGVFYAAGDDGVYRSPDAGASWRRLQARGAGGASRVHALEAVETG